MAKLTVDISDDAKTWLASEVDQGRSKSPDALVRRAIRRERERLDPNYQYSDDDIDDLLTESRESGINTRSMDEILADAMKAVEARKAARG